ncbi:MAG: ABC transporter ATP-binding protein [Pseudomonadota bacterium]
MAEDAPPPDTLDAPPAVAADRPLLRIASVTKRFGGYLAVDQLSLDIRAGEFFALLGPSGCGKTTLLRMIAGFETPDSGEILLDGENIADRLPHQRPFNMMFQNYALFPHLSVEGNVGFGLKRLGMQKADIKEIVGQMLSLVQLEGLGKRRPDQLSGGQRQRVALARSLALRPKILLLDEPMAALDKKLRESTQRELLELQRKLNMTFIIVTHDQDEAMTVADRIGVMDGGRLEQVAPPRQLYEAPRSRWIAEFVGDVNVFEGKVTGEEHGRVSVETRDAGTVIAPKPPQARDNATLIVGIRPEKVRISQRGPVSDLGGTGAMNRLPGVIMETGYLGNATIYTVKLDSGGTVRANVANATRLDADSYHAGQRVMAWFAPADCVVLDP